MMEHRRHLHRDLIIVPARVRLRRHARRSGHFFPGARRAAPNEDVGDGVRLPLALARNLIKKNSTTSAENAWIWGIGNFQKFPENSIAGNLNFRLFFLATHVGYYGEMSKDACELLAFAAGEIAARTWEKESAGASLDAASARMTRRLYQNRGVASVREVARTNLKLEARRWITDVGGNPCASAYALVRADRCARDRNLAYALNARGLVGPARA